MYLKMYLNVLLCVCETMMIEIVKKSVKDSLNGFTNNHFRINIKGYKHIILTR